MSIPKIYRWDDDNAPIMNGTLGMLNKLLMACLVEGYGDQQAAGWLLQYANEEKSIIGLRNNPQNGGGFFLRVDDTGTSTATVQGYELMSELDIGVGPFFSAAQTMRKSYTADNSPRRWLLAATESFFYLFIYTVCPTSTAFNFSDSGSNNAVIAILCFGKLRTVTDDGFPALLGIGYVDYPNQSYARAYGLCTSPVSCGSAGNVMISSPRPASGQQNSPTALTMISGGGPVYWTGSYDSKRAVGPEYTAGRLFLARPSLADGTTADPRGFLPGFYYPCHRWDDFTPLALSTLNESGRKFLVIPYARWVNTNERTMMTILLDVEDWAL